MVDIEILRHSAAHVLAMAVKELYPGAKLGIGPATEEGFYYDFDNLEIKEEELVQIEKKCIEIIRKNLKFEKSELDKKKAKEILKNEPYKLELLQDIEKPSFYKTGDFIDLCSGPHVENTKEIKAFKLLRLAGAYWKGDSKNKMLTRIYGTAFGSEKELKEFLRLREEAEKRNHVKIGKEMGIFMISDLVGKGLPIWLPRGNAIKEEVEKLAKEKEKEDGYVRVSTPLLGKKELYLKSGHLPYYEESMYPAMVMDDGTYYLKAMNCPHHHLIFKHELRSYREMPLRIAEYGICHRNELSGTLTGLIRVRAMNMNDAHIYCTKEQIEEEFENVIKLIQDYYKIFNLQNYWFRLSKWDPNHKDKYIDQPKNWEYTENILRNVLKRLKVKFVEAENEAAFYGPKVDIQFKSVTGREESMSTIQLDFLAKERFELSYQDKDGKENKEVFVIHRAPLSTHERFMAFLIEHFAGKSPLWLSPVQVKVVNITERNLDYSKKIFERLKKEDIRVELDERSESLSKKVRDAQIEKVNFVITIGDKEEEKKTLAIRDREGKTEFNVNLEDFIKKIKEQINARTI